MQRSRGLHQGPGQEGRAWPILWAPVPVWTTDQVLWCLITAQSHFYTCWKPGRTGPGEGLSCSTSS